VTAEIVTVLSLGAFVVVGLRTRRRASSTPAATA